MEIQDKTNELEARVAFLERVLAIRGTAGDAAMTGGRGSIPYQSRGLTAADASSSDRTEEASEYEEICRLRRESGELLRL